MDRRTVILVVGGSLLAMPFASGAQTPAKVWRIGMLDVTSAALNAPNFDAFRQSLRQLGYVEGQNVLIDYRYGDGRNERLPDFAAEFVRLKADVIVTRGTPAALAAKNASATTPIVMAAIGEAVGTGLVTSLARPGANVTGLSGFVTQLVAKRIELLREVVPKISRIALLDNMRNVSVLPRWEETKRAARAGYRGAAPRCAQA